MPSIGVAENLANDLAMKGTIFLYGPYEKRIINGLMAVVPDLAPTLKPIIDRLVDLQPGVSHGGGIQGAQYGPPLDDTLIA